MSSARFCCTVPAIKLFKCALEIGGAGAGSGGHGLRELSTTSSDAIERRSQSTSAKKLRSTCRHATVLPVRALGSNPRPEL